MASTSRLNVWAAYPNVVRLVKFLAGKTAWRDKRHCRQLAALEEIGQAGELELDPDLDAGHCIPPAIMARIDAF